MPYLRQAVANFPHLPPLPLVALFDRLEAERTCESACKKAGISDRTLRDWRAGTRKTAKFDTADRILIRLSLFWWEVWTSDNCTAAELALVEFAFTGERPGQGEQLELAA